MIEPLNFLESAKQIVGSFNDEVSRRNCISRAYYSAYHACLVVSRSLNLELPEGAYGSHSRLIKALRDNSKTHYLGIDLGYLKNFRTKADYHLGATISKRDAEMVISRVEDLISDVHKLFECDEETYD